MSANKYIIEPFTLFSKSALWSLNRDFYLEKGISAWSEDLVPHHMTSNSKVGKIYAELILAFLKDLAIKKKVHDKVYILELGAGHGRLAFHILKHLENLIKREELSLPAYCYVLSDIVEANLSFFLQHAQFEYYFQKGLLDVSYFDAMESNSLFLKYAKKEIHPSSLEQPLIAIANYFFDSIPSELFYVQNAEISTCAVSIESGADPVGLSAEDKIKNMELTFKKDKLDEHFYEEAALNDLLDHYRNELKSSYLFFPEKAISCLINLRNISKEGLLLLSMDKGYHELHDLQNINEADVVNHGSISIWVNYHAIGNYCQVEKGKALFPSFSNFHLDMACLLFLKDAEHYKHVDKSFKSYVDDFGPDDFNSIKQMAYNNLAKLSIIDIISLVRLSAYDSTFFIKLFPRLKQLLGTMSYKERKRLREMSHHVWDMYFYIHEEYDLAYELGGILYDLAFYNDALIFFDHSISIFGQKADIYYNKALCFYQLRQDVSFYKTLKEAKLDFPGFVQFSELERLDMT